MSDRLIICVGCGAELQRNTPLDKGGTLLPAPGLCDACAEAQREDAELAAKLKARAEAAIAASPPPGGALTALKK